MNSYPEHDRDRCSTLKGSYPVNESLLGLERASTVPYLSSRSATVKYTGLVYLRMAMYSQIHAVRYEGLYNGYDLGFRW